MQTAKTDQTQQMPRLISLTCSLALRSFWWFCHEATHLFGDLDLSPNLLGTDKIVPLLFTPQAGTPSATKCHRRKKHIARPGLEPKMSRTLCEHSDH